MNYIGIDPGASGGIAVLDRKGTVRHIRSMPDTPRDLLDLLGVYDSTRHPDAEAVAVLERVWSSPGWGHVGAFKFGMSFGGLRVALAAVRVSFDEVLPRTWQTIMGVSYPAKATQTEKKNISKQRAQALFPQVSVTHAIADALLLAEYCRRLHVAGSQVARSAPQTKRS